MMSLNVVFWLFIAVFGLIGMSRGWAKELLVSFSVIVGVFIIVVLETYVPFIRDGLARDPGGTIFYVRAGILLGMVFFGYQSPNLPRIAGNNRFAREKLQDALLGLFLGAVNGYLIMGTMWHFIDAAGYPFAIILPPPDGPGGDAARELIKILPPVWLRPPMVFFAVALAFAFIIIVFI